MLCWRQTNPLTILGTTFLVLATVFMLAAFPAHAWAAPGATVTCFTTGTSLTCTVLSESGGGAQGTVALGNGTTAVIPLNTAGTVTIPATVKIVDAWEQGRTFTLSRIAAHAFDMTGGTEALERISIAGTPEIDPNAFVGLPVSVTFIVDNLTMAEQLERAGIALERIFYQENAVRYVAFGDSIAAGYALPGYDTTNPCYDGQPTPRGAFPLLVTDRLRDRFQTAQLDNEAMSGWTSKQLLDQLNRGDYNAALANADVVTITIGSNDLLMRFIEIIEDAVVNAVNAERISAGETGPGITGFPDITEGYLTTLHGKKPGIIGDIVDNVNSAIENDPQLLVACDTFKNVNQPAILARLHELAPHATIYWTTLYNPFYGTELNLEELFPALGMLYPRKDLSIDLSGAGAHYIEIMNRAFETPVGYYAVDLYGAFNNPGLTNVEIKRDVDGSLVFNVDPHPNPDGHALIGRLMNAQIDATFVAEQPNSGWASDLLAMTREPADKVKDARPPASNGKLTAATGDQPLAPTVFVAAVAALALALVSGRRAKFDLPSRDLGGQRGWH